MLPETFETARLLLRPVAAVDVGAIFDTYAQDEEVTRYAIWRPHRNRSQTQASVEPCIATPADLERTYMLVGREDDVVRGAFALHRRAPAPSRLRLCAGTPVVAAGHDD
jgi:ribosomal-protein-alanine N-acetyltransferase